jgi:hypothetical protein
MPDPVKKTIKDDPLGETKRTTKGGTYVTTGEANIWFQLTEFTPSCLFRKHKFKVDRDAKSASYNIILGFWSCPHLHQVCFQAQQSTIDKAEDEFLKKQCFSQAQYQAADLHKCLPTHLSSQQKEKLHTLLNKHQFLFKGTLLPTKPVHVKLKSNAKPFHGCAFSLPFEIYTDASKYQIGSIITQKDKPLAFYSRKLPDPQTRYTVT